MEDAISQSISQVPHQRQGNGDGQHVANGDPFDKAFLLIEGLGQDGKCDVNNVGCKMREKGSNIECNMKKKELFFFSQLDSICYVHFYHPLELYKLFFFEDLFDSPNLTIRQADFDSAGMCGRFCQDVFYDPFC